MNGKVCLRCNTWKPLVEFYKNEKQGSLGRQSYCKICNRKRSAKYNAANKDEIRKQRAEYRAANKDEIRKYQAEYRAANKDKICKRQAEYRAKKKAEDSSDA